MNKINKLTQEDINVIKSLISNSKSDLYILDIIYTKYGKVLPISKLEDIKMQLKQLKPTKKKKGIYLATDIEKEIKETRKFIKRHSSTMPTKDIDELYSIVSNCLMELRNLKKNKKSMIL